MSLLCSRVLELDILKFLKLPNEERDSQELSQMKKETFSGTLDFQRSLQGIHLSPSHGPILRSKKLMIGDSTLNFPLHSNVHLGYHPQPQYELTLGA